MLRLFSCLAVLITGASATSAERPNLIILYADDMGFGDLGANNPESRIPTPRLDQLAAEGMRFTDGHSSSGICTPSRYALLTGRRHWRDFHGIVNAMGGPVFKPDQLTLPAMLREKGYTTACIGKWHLGWNWNAIKRPDAETETRKRGNRNVQVWGPEDYDWSKPIPGGPLDRGFDHYFGDSVINFPPYCWIEDKKVTTSPDAVFPPEPYTVPTKEGSWEARPGPGLSDWDFYQVLPTLADKGVAWIKSRKDADKPFFLYFPFPSPHAPIIPTDEFDEKSEAGAYGDFVYQTDHICGRILDALEQAGKSDNTIVIFTSDNGPENYAYNRDAKHDHWSSRPLRGLKRDILEGGHRVPFLIRWPGKLKAGTVSDALVSQTDIMATLASLIDYDLPTDAAVDSLDFLPYLTGETKDSPRHTMVHNTYKGGYALRHGEWVLIDAKSGAVRPTPKPWLAKHDTPPETGPLALYDLEKDLGQRQNLAETHPEKVAELKRRLKDILESERTAPKRN
ncbi:MAG: arylsulfatase [Verrucomicrobiota bacterium]